MLPSRQQLTSDHEPACMCHLYRLRIKTHVLNQNHALLYRATLTSHQTPIFIPSLQSNSFDAPDFAVNAFLYVITLANRERQCFHRCLSVHMGGVCLSACGSRGCTPPGRPPPNTPGKTPPPTIPPETATAVNGTHTSYWNTFLLPVATKLWPRLCFYSCL